MSAPLDSLVTLLDLEAIEMNLFRGHSPADEKRVRAFGGQVAGQALVAAGRTVDPDKHVHSLHAYFLRPGDVSIPILYQVDRIRDGKSFATRRVVAIQRGEAIFNLSASFHRLESGPSHQMPMPDAPQPESLKNFREQWADYADKMGDWFTRPRPIDMRYVTPPIRTNPGRREPNQKIWMRADGNLPDDPLLHACVVAYASDISLLDSVFMAHDVRWEDGSAMGASLDHAMWFHSPLRADEWFLYCQESTSSGGARGLARGELFSRDGRLLVSVVQEGLVRVLNPVRR